MKLIIHALGSKNEILMSDQVKINAGHASEKELQDFVLHRFQDQDLSDRCRLAVKSFQIFILTTTFNM